MGPEDLRTVIEIDAEATLLELEEAGAMELLSLAPFGAGNPPPLVMLRGVDVALTPEVKNDKHLFIKVRQGEVMKVVKGWGMAELAGQFREGDRVDVAALVEEDAWGRVRGGAGWGLILKDIRMVER